MTEYTDVSETGNSDYNDEPSFFGLLLNVATNSQFILVGLL